ncbi:AraC family transcriptional regulator [Chloroflexi bacterium TSY]|nr:AraC family transcriptional regulator [Chloroflexi bacterium TSY]
MYTSYMNIDTERLLPVLIHIQTHLEDNLSLEALAQQADLSPFHFHRIFRATIGETVKQYVQRLRLERAAYFLKIQDASIIDVAVCLGYQSHETFTRAFRRQFGIAPKEYRTAHRFVAYNKVPDDSALKQPLNEQTTSFSISRVHVCMLEPIEVAFIRHLGAYTETDLSSFDKLIRWIQEKGFYDGQNLLIGIGHDDPTVTPEEKVRFDACIEVPKPDKADGEIGFQTIPEGAYATVTYVGPYGAAMYQAYEYLFHQMQDHKRYNLVGLPAIEIYRTTQINPEYTLNQTDIYLPVEEK